MCDWPFEEVQHKRLDSSLVDLFIVRRLIKHVVEHEIVLHKRSMIQ